MQRLKSVVEGHDFGEDEGTGGAELHTRDGIVVSGLIFLRLLQKCEHTTIKLFACSRLHLFLSTSFIGGAIPLLLELLILVLLLLSLAFLLLLLIF